MVKNASERHQLLRAFAGYDVVLLFVFSVHLYYLFPSLEEGGLATYRTAIVQNQHLAMLAKVGVIHGPVRCRTSPDLYP